MCPRADAVPLFLPLFLKTLGALADKCAAYAKALHYKEIEFQTSPATTCEALISINNHLDLPEAAVGILLYAQQHYDIELKESWYEKLQRWDQAKEVRCHSHLLTTPALFGVTPLIRCARFRSP